MDQAQIKQTFDLHEKTLGEVVDEVKSLKVQLSIPTTYDDFVKALHQLSAGHSRTHDYAPPAKHSSYGNAPKAEVGVISDGPYAGMVSNKALLDAPSDGEDDE
jgi:hypothetical protein